MFVHLTLNELCVRFIVVLSFIGGRNVRIMKNVSTIRMYWQISLYCVISTTDRTDYFLLFVLQLTTQ